MAFLDTAEKIPQDGKISEERDLAHRTGLLTANQATDDHSFAILQRYGRIRTAILEAIRLDICHVKRRTDFGMDLSGNEPIFMQARTAPQDDARLPIGKCRHRRSLIDGLSRHGDLATDIDDGLAPLQRGDIRTRVH